MPKLVKKLNTSGPPYLLDQFSVINSSDYNKTSYTYTKNAAENLRLWVRFDSSLAELVGDDSGHTITPEYIGSPSRSENNVYHSKIKVSKFSDTGNSSAKITFGDGAGSGNDNIISFTEGASGPDKPFSVGFWFKKSEDAAASALLFGKTKVRSASNFDNSEYYAEYNVTEDKLIFTLIDASTIARRYADTVSISSILSHSLGNGQWHYVAFTYDPPGGANPETGIKVYVNGVLITINSTGGIGSGVYTSMEKKSDIFYIAAAPYKENITDTAETNGSFGELGIWGKVLSIEEIKAIYYASYDKFSLKSGYLSQPTRIKVRELDNAFSSRPTFVRTGDRDRTGLFSRKPFNDKNTLLFGKKLKDDFGSYADGFAKNLLNKKKWETTTTCRIKNNSFVFIGLNRVLRTLNSLTGISKINFNLEVGSVFSPTRLKTPNSNDKLLVQWSSSGAAPWTTIKTISLWQFKNIRQVLIPGQKNTSSISILSSEIYGKFKNGYIRFAQTSENSFVSTTQPVCAISLIEIEYADENITPLIGVDKDTASGQNIYSSSLMSPNYLNDSSLIVSNSKTFFGAGNNYSPVENSESFSPFIENSPIDNNDVFYKEELKLLDEELNPVKIENFSLSPRSKTRLTFDLSVSSKRTFGNTVKAPAETGTANRAGGGFKQAFFYPITYYQKSQKRWQGTASGPGHFTAFVGVNAPDNQSFESSIAGSGKLLGFGPLDAVASGSDRGGVTNHDDSLIKYLPADAISSYVRPVRTFGFPTLGQYSHESADCFKMKNYTNKPFLLEKCTLEFNARFEFAASGDQGENQYGLRHYYNDTANSQPSDRFNTYQHKVIIPTFFILRQKKVPNNFETTLTSIVDDAGIQTKVTNIYSGSTGVKRFEGNTTRELVTYGQMTLYASSSAPLTSTKRFDIDLQEVLDRGLSRDLDYDILQGQTWDPDNSESLPAVTGSFKMNFPCREVSKTPASQRLYISGANGLGLASNANNIYAVLLGDEVGGRNIDELNGSERSYFRGKQSQKLSEPYETFGTARADDPISITPPKKNSIDVPSPYLLMPDDELIFGWHYPINNDHVFHYAAAGDTRRNIMILEGESKLHMYGSLISDKKEYHETLNQPLYTDSIFETVIGGDKVIDQFDINTPAELSGTYIDNYPIVNETKTFTGNVFGFSYSYTIPEGRAGEELHGLVPQDRVGNFLGSLINKRDSYKQAGVSSVFNNSRENAIGQFQKFISCRNEEESGIDNSFTEIFPLYGQQKTSKNTKIYTNHRHYGYMSDIYQQRKLVRTSRNPGLSPAGEDTMPKVTNYTVQAKFIIRLPIATSISPTGNSGELAINESSIITKETYDYKELEAVIGTSGFDGSVLNIAQSSNTSIHMTSSFPYNDNDINTEAGKKYRNKNYPSENTIFFELDTDGLVSRGFNPFLGN